MLQLTTGCNHSDINMIRSAICTSHGKEMKKNSILDSLPNGSLHAELYSASTKISMSGKGS